MRKYRNTVSNSSGGRNYLFHFQGKRFDHSKNQFSKENCGFILDEHVRLTEDENLYTVNCSACFMKDIYD